VHEEHVLPHPLDAGAGDARQILFLLVHVGAHAGADAAADRRAHQDLVELSFSQERAQHRPGCGADGRSFPGLVALGGARLLLRCRLLLGAACEQ